MNMFWLKQESLCYISVLFSVTGRKDINDLFSADLAYRM